MAFPGTGTIWMNGKQVDWKDANIHIASHVIHYGSGVFEGARGAAAPFLLALPQAAARAVGSLPVLRRSTVVSTAHHGTTKSTNHTKGLCTKGFFVSFVSSW